MVNLTLTPGRSAVDKPEYDRPDEPEEKGSKALIFIVLAVTVIGVFYFGYFR